MLYIWIFNIHHSHIIYPNSKSSHQIQKSHWFYPINSTLFRDIIKKKLKTSFLYSTSILFIGRLLVGLLYTLKPSHRILKTRWFYPYKLFLWKNDDSKKNQFKSCWVYTQGTIPPGNLLKIYICIYFHFPLFIVFLYNRLPRCTVPSASNSKLPNWFFTTHFLLTLSLLHLSSLKVWKFIS